VRGNGVSGRLRPSEKLDATEPRTASVAAAEPAANGLGPCEPLADAPMRKPLARKNGLVLCALRENGLAFRGRPVLGPGSESGSRSDSSSVMLTAGVGAWGRMCSTEPCTALSLGVGDARELSCSLCHVGVNDMMEGSESRGVDARRRWLVCLTAATALDTATGSANVVGELTSPAAAVGVCVWVWIPKAGAYGSAVVEVFAAAGCTDWRIKGAAVQEEMRRMPAGHGCQVLWVYSGPQDRPVDPRLHPLRRMMYATAATKTTARAAITPKIHAGICECTPCAVPSAATTVSIDDAVSVAKTVLATAGFTDVESWVPRELEDSDAAKLSEKLG
jgi:hypothetical protein